MQPQEFNAFVAAIVSARAANLISAELAREVVEQQCMRFLNRITVGPMLPSDVEGFKEAMNDRR